MLESLERFPSIEEVRRYVEEGMTAEEEERLQSSFKLLSRDVLAIWKQVKIRYYRLPKRVRLRYRLPGLLYRQLSTRRKTCRAK